MERPLSRLRDLYKSWNSETVFVVADEIKYKIWRVFKKNDSADVEQLKTDYLKQTAIIWPGYGKDVRTALAGFDGIWKGNI